jgi:hypothetical protein
MDETRVLDALEAEDMEPSTQSMSDFLASNAAAAVVGAKI